MKKLSLFLVALIMIIPSILFNAWFLQCIYELGVIPILSTFNISGPTISFGIFVMIYMIITTIYASNNSKTYDNASEFVAGMMGIILTKLFKLGLLYVVNLIIF